MKVPAPCARAITHATNLPQPEPPIPSRDREGADLPQPILLTFTGAVLPNPLGAVRKEPPQQ